MLEKTLESPLDSKEIKAVNPKGNQPWLFTGRTDAKTEAPILWPPYAKKWLIGKDPDARKDWGQEEKRVTEDEMVRWHHWLSGNKFEQNLGDSEGEGNLVCCSPWNCREWDETEWLNNNKDWTGKPFSLICIQKDHSSHQRNEWGRKGYLHGVKERYVLSPEDPNPFLSIMRSLCVLSCSVMSDSLWPLGL